jgi:hypothetical protein
MEYSLVPRTADPDVPRSTAFELRSRARDGVQPGAFAHVRRDALGDSCICRACGRVGNITGEIVARERQGRCTSMCEKARRVGGG